MQSRSIILALLVCSFAVFAIANPGDVDVEDVQAASDATDVVAEDITVDVLSAEEKEALEGANEKFEFQAEVNRLMDIIINSIYSNREIFIRELISNASDALDKIRFASLTDKAVLGERPELEIRIKPNKEAKTLTFIDTGCGMTRQNLVNQLGVVARSGTTEFVEAIAQNQDSISLIGQFGVGFYSVYLAADKVTVTSKNNDDKQHVWESTADSTFTVAEDPRGNTLGRGTAVTLHLKEDAEEYLQENTLERIVSKYSEFIQFPIYLWTSKTVEEEVEIEEEEEVAAEDEEPKEDEDDVDVTDDDDEEKEEKKKTKTVSKTVNEWKRINDVKAIWTRSPKEVTEEEYDGFYKDISKDTSGPATHIHFKAEGEISFKSILYIPSTSPPGYYDKFYEKSNSLKLYVRKVLISDEFEDLMPRYLNFIKGVVDSEDLPLNVSRETLAQSRVLKVMGKKLTRKALEMLRKLAESEEEDEEEEEEEEEEGEEKDDEEEEKTEKKNDKYKKFWEGFGKSIKLGMVDDQSNRSKLSKLLRYTSSKSDGDIISLQDYVDDMDDKQKYIYYITGQSVEEVENSPFLEKLKERDFEVLYMVDPLDEYVIQNLSEFDGKKLMSVTKEGLKFGDEGTRTKNKMEKLKEDFKDLTEWMKESLGDKVEKVVVSNRIAQSPCVLVTGQYGWSANMERIMKAQTFADAKQQQWMFSKKTMEINPRHPIILELQQRATASADDAELKDLVALLYDAALLRSGFVMDDSSDFSSRIHRVLSKSLNVDEAPKLEAEVNPEDDDQWDDPIEEEADVDVDSEVDVDLDTEEEHEL